MNELTPIEMCEDIARLIRWLEIEFESEQSQAEFGPYDPSQYKFLRSLKARLVQIVACLADEDPSKTEAQLHKCRKLKGKPS